MSLLIKLFDIENEKVVPTSHCYTLSFLKDIMEKYPKNYIKIFTYLQYMSSWNPEDNPYLAMKEEDREESILEDIKCDFSTEDDLIQIALKKCQKMTELPSLRMWRAGKIMLDKMAYFLETTQVTSGKDGSYKDASSALKEFHAHNEAYNKGYKTFMEDIRMNIRGDKFISKV